MSYFTIDNDREQYLNSDEILASYEEESAMLIDTIVEKFVNDELDTMQLIRFLSRKRDVDYFIGRMDGEKYKEDKI